MSEQTNFLIGKLLDHFAQRDDMSGRMTMSDKRPPICHLFPEHGEREWCECWQCGGEGVYGHDCGEDCCCCLYPEDNKRCDICRGKGGWWRCYTCAPETVEEQR